MKLKLTPDELYQSFQLLSEPEKLAFMQHLSNSIIESYGLDPDEFDSEKLDDDTDDGMDDDNVTPFWGVDEIVCDETKPSREMTLRIALKGINPPIWRKLIVPSNINLESLAHVLLLAMAWDCAHLHQFVQNRTFYAVPMDEDDFGMPFDKDFKKDSRQYTLGDLLTNEKSTALFEYDFGDSWEHKITVQGIREYEAGECRTRVALVGGKRACPIEDIGGVWGYMNYIEALKHPYSKASKELFEWYGKFDPEEFDKDEFAQLIDNIRGNGK
ncbi:MAG: plasmid pRiA4b ORF-3 family protein [Bacteroidales bacterium]|nr:plasmid pRiA4b ORF-3 family protein [Candidatus Sodaliphilus aphodohippi]